MVDLSPYIVKQSFHYPSKGELYLLSDYSVDPAIKLNHSCRIYTFLGEDRHGDMLFDLLSDDDYADIMFAQGYDSYMIEVNLWGEYVRDQRAWHLTKGCNHFFPNNGLLLSWCKHCGQKGSFNRDSCKFEEV